MEKRSYKQYEESAETLRQRIEGFNPRVLLILGSGLGDLGNEVENAVTVPYTEVPHMKHSTAPDHKGQFVFGRLAGQNVMVMQGRLHTYEGWSMAAQLCVGEERCAADGAILQMPAYAVAVLLPQK